MRQMLLKVMAILGFILVLNEMGVTRSSQAQASQLKDALVTIGIGTVAGTVIGLSTLPFYGYPEDHLENILIGAGVGIVAGLGIALYLVATPENGSSESVGIGSPNTEKLLAKKENLYQSVPTRDPLRTQRPGQRPQSSLSSTFSQRPQQWGIAVNLLSMAF